MFMSINFFTLLLVILIVFFVAKVSAQNKSREELREQEGLELQKKSLEIAKLYDLPVGVDLLDITDKILTNPQVNTNQRIKIEKQQRRIFLFSYPSDGVNVKGFVSLVPNADQSPLIVFLRGGNRKFGLLNPGGVFTTPEGYTILATAYRGGVSEGEDEFGGKDVSDVKNLIAFIPQLEAKINRIIGNGKIFMIGGSRGGMQMFLALSRYPELQEKVEKIVSLSGLTNMRACVSERADMKEMFINDFGLTNENEDDWLNNRDPMVAVENIRKDLPILIIHGTNDIRVTRHESYSLVEKLQANGNNVTYMEINDGEHCLYNLSEPLQPVINWLKQNEKMISVSK